MSLWLGPVHRAPYYADRPSLALFQMAFDPLGGANSTPTGTVIVSLYRRLNQDYLYSGAHVSQWATRLTSEKETSFPCEFISLPNNQ